MTMDEFRLELISQWIKMKPVIWIAALMFRLELISQWIKMSSTMDRPVVWVPARAHFPMD